MLRVGNYEPGSNITLLNNYYIKPYKDENGKWTKGVMTLIYKDLDTGRKYKEEIENPDYEYYILKDEYSVSNNEHFMQEDKLEKITVPYVDLEKDIAQRTGNLEFFYDNLKNKNRQANKMLHTNARIFNSDMDIEDHYRFRFDKTYRNESFTLRKMFFDIEADTKYMAGDFPEPGECPVNALTAVDMGNMKAYVLLLRTEENLEQIVAFERFVRTGEGLKQVYQFIEDKIGGPKRLKKFLLNKLQLDFHFYDELDEINLIGDFFRLVNANKPDFCVAWNAVFDIPYLLQRIINLGYNPLDIACHKDFKYKQAYYYHDTRAMIAAERGDYCVISSYTIYTCQMIQFASRRKANEAKLPSGLNDVGKMTCKIQKLDYSHITTNIAKLPYLDFYTFVLYNIFDTLVQYCIEFMVGDLDYIFNKCLLNNTRLCKGHRQTIYLTNRACKFYENRGLIIGNNVNKFNEKPKDKFPGAFVAESLAIHPSLKVRVNGVPVKVYRNGDDFDFKSLYPSIEREFNIAPHTQIGRIEIEKQVYNNENPFNNPYFNRGSQLLDDLQSKSYIEIGIRWFGLPSFVELYNHLLKVTGQLYGVERTPYNDNGLYNPIIGGEMVIPINVYDEYRLVNPIEVYSPMPSLDFRNKIEIGEIVYENGYMYDDGEDETDEE